MAGVFDWARLLTGDRDNPEEDIGQWSDENQKRNRAALGLDANGNPLPAAPAAPAAAAAPGGAPADPNAPPNADAQGAAQAQASSTLPPQQEPNATKTPVSLGHLMMNLQQYNEREQGFNQALGQGFAAFAQPRDRDMVSKMFNVTPADPTKIAATQQNLGMNQQGQDRMNALGQMIHGPQGDGIAQRLNISKDELIARYQADPAGVGNMIQSFASPTDQMKNLQQINTYAPQIQGAPGSNASDLQSLRTLITANVAGPEAAAMVADQIKYRQTHNGQEAPWKDQPQAYKQWASDQKTIADNQSDAGKSLSAGVAKTEMLRAKVSDLQNNPGLKRILALPNTDPVKQAAWNAVNDTDPNWQKNVAYSAIISDPQIMQTISELKEINGQEYTGAIDSLLGHGLRPSQTEVGAVREGFGQTKNLLNFSNIKDYTAQAVNPMLTRLDEAEATGYGASGQLKSMPARLQPFVHPVYLKGGNMHPDDGAAPEDWEKNVNKPLPDDLATKAQAKIQAEPWNAFAIRDGLRRKGYRVEF